MGKKPHHKKQEPFEDRYAKNAAKKASHMLLDRKCDIFGRLAAVEELSTLGASAANHVDALMQSLKEDVDLSLQRAAAAALRKLGEFLSAESTALLVPHVFSDDALIGPACFAALCNAHALVLLDMLDGDKVPSWASAVDFRACALQSVGAAGAKMTPYAARLAEHLDDCDARVSGSCILSLCQLGSSDGSVVEPHLQAICQRMGASAVSTDANRPFEKLVRLASLKLLDLAGEGASCHTDVIAHWLTHNDTSAYYFWLFRSPYYGDSCDPACEKMLGIRSGDSSCIAADLATKILSKPAIALAAMPSVVPYLDDINSNVRLRALRVIRAVGIYAVPHLPRLAHCLQDRDVTIVGATLRALGRLGEAAVPHAEAMCNCLRDADWTVRLDAARALGHLGRDVIDVAANAFAEMAEHDPDSRVRKGVEEALSIMQRPIRIVVIHPSTLNSDGTIDIECTSLSGRQIASVRVGQREPASKLKEELLMQLSESAHNMRLVTPSATILEDTQIMMDIHAL